MHHQGIFDYRDPERYPSAGHSAVEFGRRREILIKIAKQEMKNSLRRHVKCLGIK